MIGDESWILYENTTHSTSCGKGDPEQTRNACLGNYPTHLIPLISLLLIITFSQSKNVLAGKSFNNYDTLKNEVSNFFGLQPSNF